MRSLVLILLLAGCAAETAPPADAPAPSLSFDAQDWLARARTWSFDPMVDEDDAGITDSMRALAEELNVAVDWTRACNTYVDAETGAVEMDSLGTTGGHYTRGLLDVAEMSPTEAIVAVTCDFGAYQGSYALVHIEGKEAQTLRAAALTEGGQPTRFAQTAFSTPRWDALANRQIETFGLMRGLGDCGTLTTYSLTASDSLATDAVRQRDCSDTPPPDLDPATWPLVYPAN